MTIDLTDIIRTAVLIVLIIACWKIVKLAAKQWMHDRRLQYRRIRRRYGAQAHKVKPRHAANSESNGQGIWSDLLGEDVPDDWKPTRHNYEAKEYNEMRQGAQR